MMQARRRFALNVNFARRLGAVNGPAICDMLASRCTPRPSERFNNPVLHWIEGSRSVELAGDRWWRQAISVGVSVTSTRTVRLGGQRLNDGLRLSTPKPVLLHRRRCCVGRSRPRADWCG